MEQPNNTETTFSVGELALQARIRSVFADPDYPVYKGDICLVGISGSRVQALLATMSEELTHWGVVISDFSSETSSAVSDKVIHIATPVQMQEIASAVYISPNRKSTWPLSGELGWQAIEYAGYTTDEILAFMGYFPIDPASGITREIIAELSLGIPELAIELMKAAEPVDAQMKTPHSQTNEAALIEIMKKRVKMLFGKIVLTREDVDKYFKTTQAASVVNYMLLQNPSSGVVDIPQSKTRDIEDI